MCPRPSGRDRPEEQGAPGEGRVLDHHGRSSRRRWLEDDGKIGDRVRQPTRVDAQHVTDDFPCELAQIRRAERLALGWEKMWRRVAERVRHERGLGEGIT